MIILIYFTETEWKDVVRCFYMVSNVGISLSIDSIITSQQFENNSSFSTRSLLHEVVNMVSAVMDHKPGW